MISAGALNRRVRIEGPTITYDPESNEAIETFGLVAEVWARRVDGTAREALQVGSVRAEQVAVFVIWYREGITTQHRLISQGQTFNVTGISEIGQRYQLQITGTADANAATGAA